jgi:hypothetical protein
VTVIDNVATTPLTASPNVSFRQLDDFGSGSDPEVYVLRAVKSDPFVTISEIRGLELDQKLGWWQVFRILRKNRLLRRKSRFRYAWGRS